VAWISNQNCAVEFQERRAPAARLDVSHGDGGGQNPLEGLRVLLVGIDQGCLVLSGSRGFEEGVDVDGGAPSGIFDVIAAMGA
jgi:hypothetical protein